MEKDKRLLIIIGISCLILGIALMNLYLILNRNIQKHCNDGYFLKDSSEPSFEVGDWVCINIEDMAYDRAVEVCKHEVGHEIFAEICEKDFDKCKEVLK